MLPKDLTAFSPTEYQRRLSELRHQMAQNNMDAILLTTDANHRYFTGHVTHRWTHKYTAIFALLPQQGEPVLIVTPMEACMCEADSWIKTIRTFAATHIQQGIHVITDTVRDLGLETSRIGTELGGVMWMRMPPNDFYQLQQNLPQVEFTDASSLLWKIRACKSNAEVDLIRQAVAITDQAYQALFATVEVGMSEQDIYRILAVEHLSRGAETPGSITLAPYIPGTNSPVNQTLRRHTNRILTQGELIAQDAGGIYQGYWSDYTRMYALGQARHTHQEGYRVVYSCLQSAIAATRAGVPIANLVNAAKVTMVQAGHAEYANRVSGIGHAMGLEIIEPPFIAFENDVMLEAGMILTIEPSLLIDGAFIMLEEDVLVTTDGCEVLSAPAPKDLPIL